MVNTRRLSSRHGNKLVSLEGWKGFSGLLRSNEDLVVRYRNGAGVTEDRRLLTEGMFLDFITSLDGFAILGFFAVPAQGVTWWKSMSAERIRMSVDPDYVYEQWSGIARPVEQAVFYCIARGITVSQWMMVGIAHS